MGDMKTVGFESLKNMFFEIKDIRLE